MGRPKPTPQFTCKPMQHDSFAVFVLTYNRPHLQHTVKTLARQGYTGQIYLIVDDSDPSLDEYLKLYGEQVIIFSKEEVHRTLGIDRAKPGDSYHGVVFARNAAFRIAAQLGIEHFVALDDDYKEFLWYLDDSLRPLTSQPQVRCLNTVFDAAIDLYEAAQLIHFSYTTTNNFIGGIRSQHLSTVHLERKTLNVYFASPKRPHKFYGLIYEDVNTYMALGRRGALMYLYPAVAVRLPPSTVQPGGLTDLYHSTGDYARIFLSVMYCPSCVSLLISDKSPKPKPRVSWKAITPVVLREQYRKARSPYQRPQVQNDDLPDEYLSLVRGQR